MSRRGAPGVLDPDRYDAIAEAFDRYSERTGFPITACLLEMTRVSGGDQVLDVACGSGIVTRRAAALVGEGGRAVGIDLSPGQIRVARQRARAEGLSWASFFVMDAMQLAFADHSFDVAVAEFPHFPDRDRCIGEMFRALAPGGRFAICNGGGGAPVWQLANAPPPTTIPREAILDGLFRSCLEAHFPARLAPPARGAAAAPPDPQGMLGQELQRAGFDEIALWSYAFTAPFHKAEEAFEWESIRISSYRMQTDLDPRRVSAFKQAYLDEARARHERWGVLGLTTGALFGTGRKPGPGRHGRFRSTPSEEADQRRRGCA